VSSAIFLTGGALLLCLGVLGEYVGRVYDEVRQRPLSIINKVYYASESAVALDNPTGYDDESSSNILRIA